MTGTSSLTPRRSPVSADWGIAAGDLAWTANAALALQCMEMVGGATAVLDRTVEYVKVREVQGGTADVAAVWLQRELGLAG